MTNALSHRGPDDLGLWIDEVVPIAIGHRRLSIIDTSPLGHQPMVSASGRFVLTFNGEIYNFEELRATFPDYPFRGRSDTEVMLAAFENHGVTRAIGHFNGMFAFAVWDRTERILHLACDRFGEKPLYYARAGSAVLFGSELKALRSHCEFDSRIDRNVLSLFLRYNYVPKPYSIYKNAYKVEPGTCLSFQLATLSADPQCSVFWSARATAVTARSQPFKGTAEDAAVELERLLGDSVRMRMVADVPLGAFLSGGIDSTTIVAMMHKYSSRPAKTFTIGFHEKIFNEAEDARLTARKLGSDHTEFHVTPQVAMSVIPRLATIYDEPFADSSQIPTYLVSQLARQHVTVALSGDGGDEIFGGYNRYVWAGQVWDLINRYPRAARSLLAKLCESISPATWERWSTRLPGRLNVKAPGNKMHKLAGILTSINQEDLYHRLLSQWNDPASVVLGGKEVPTSMTDPENWEACATFLQQMMLTDTIGYLPNDILVKVDRAAMAVSLETRTPYLDHRLFEFVWSLPDKWKVMGGESKWLLRNVLYKYIPREIMARPKAGFGIPVEFWLRGPLRDWAEDLLDEGQLRQEGFFDPAPVRRKWAQHLSGSNNWCSPLWGILMFESWLRSRQTMSAADTMSPLVTSS
jgi:asparagine synthase (glutamine-hydrolysing)